tara:strand:- start:840 stop:1184 length:345 start_codon:yes stop_codon:yes gene_type:complete
MKLMTILQEAVAYSMFIDDLREPAKRFDVIARSSNEAIKTVKKKGVPTYISFDHDLGGDDTAMKFINWLIDAVLDGEIQWSPRFRFAVHSANPVGARNIEGKMNNFIKHMKKNK